MSQMEQILNFNAPLDIKLLDETCQAFYIDGNKSVESILVQFQNHPLAWTRVAEILETSSHPNTRLLALNILEETVKSRWATLPMAQREGIKTYTVNLIIKISSTPTGVATDAVLLKKLDLVLVAIVKHDWPQNWPNFIGELVESSKTSQSLCANNMLILMLLSEEIFDFSASTLTAEKARSMKQQLNSEFTRVYQLCEYVLQESNDPQLLLMTLKTLLRFLHWIPVGYIFETPLIDTLTMKFLTAAPFQNDTLQCLTEIGALKLKPEEEQRYAAKFIGLFTHVTRVAGSMITPQTDLARLYEQGSEQAQDFVRYLTLFISSFLKAHLTLCEQENDEVRAALLQALGLLLACSRVDDQVIFKICLEYWNLLVEDLYSSSRVQLMQRANQTAAGGFMAEGQNNSTLPPRLRFYDNLLRSLRLTLISKMAKPEEVLIVEDENGAIVREQLKDTDSVVLYKSMRECLVYLTHLDPRDTEEKMLTKLRLQVDGTEWSWHNLNTLCWAIGSISGAMTETQEKTFLVRVIKDLLGLVELKRGKEHKAVIAANIMYVVGQYPRFLKQHWKFLKTVCNKLFEFMHESHPGVQDMSVDTFVKIAKKCRKKFVLPQADNEPPFIDEILMNLPNTISALDAAQIQGFYEACAEIISSESDAQRSAALLAKLMEPPNTQWSAFITGAAQSSESLCESKTVKGMHMVLKTNCRVAAALGSAYLPQLARLYVDMLQVYVVLSQHVSSRVAREGAIVTRHADIRGMRSVKKEALNLVRLYVEHCSASERPVIVTNLLPPLLDTVLDDYKRAVPEARENEALLLMSEVVNKVGAQMSDHLPRLLDTLVHPTITMISANFTDYPDHRHGLYTLLNSCVTECFPALLRSPPNEFKLLMDSVMWAAKHLERTVAELGITVLLNIINQVSRSEFAAFFYQQYFVSLLSDLLGLITDTFHKAQLRQHAQVMQKLFGLVESGAIALPLSENPQNPLPGHYANNQEYVRAFVCALLAKAFPQLNPSQIQQFTNGLFALHTQEQEFKTHLRDFLVNLKEFHGDDGTRVGGQGRAGGQADELFADERAKQEAQDKANELARLEAVPGLLYVAPSHSVQHE